MPAKRNKAQLRLELFTRAATPGTVSLQFRLDGKPVSGLLYGSAHNWSFASESPVFRKHFPGGRLEKYALWRGKAPAIVTEAYQAIYEAAANAGISLEEAENTDV